MDEQFVSGQQPQGTIKEIEKKVATEDKQDTQITSEADKLFDYKLSGIDEGETTYLGYLNKDGAWYIAKYLSTGVTYARGSSGYNWSNRASESYGEFNNIF